MISLLLPEGFFYVIISSFSNFIKPVHQNTASSHEPDFHQGIFKTCSMQSEYLLEKKPGYISFIISGRYHADAFLSYARIIAETCKKEKLNKVLVNALEVKGTDLSVLERYFIGEKMAELLPAIKVAVVWPEKHITKFGETVARNRGAFVNVVGDVETAQKWLMANV